MIEVKITGTITNDLLMQLSEEEAEGLMENQIAEGMSNEIVANLEDMAYIDMKQNDKQNGVDWEANVIICDKDQIKSSVAIMARRLGERLGASQADIEYCLEPAVTDIKGF